MKTSASLISDQSLAIGETSAASGSGVGTGVGGSVITRPAQIRNKTKVNKNKLSMPMTLTSTGPSVAKPRSWAAVNVKLNSALAETSCDLGTSEGIVAPWAGAKNWPAIPKKKVTT